MTSTTRLTGGSIVTPGGTLEQLDVVIAHGRIIELPSPGTSSGSADTFDVTDRIVAPGLIDVQINGGWGHDFTGDPTTIGQVAAHLPSTGVTAFVPTIVSSSQDRRTAALAAIGDVPGVATSATALGLHFEGPIISPERPGAHDPRHIGMPPATELDSWTRDNGVAVVTLAPEVPGAIDLTRRLTEAGIVVSAGHTVCTTAEFAEGRAAGASMVTHLFNAMAPFSHRSPGSIGATLADSEVRAGLICDGIHVDPVAVRMAWRALGAAHIILVTDAVAALGLDDATVELGGITVTVSERGVRTADDVLAGSNLALDQAIRNLVAFTGCTTGEAIRSATTTPAEALGLTDRGRIEVGARADITIFDEHLHVERTLIEGNTAWKS